MQKRNSLEEILKCHMTVFQNELGTIQGTTAKIHVDPNICPKFCKARPIPFTLHKKVEDELERLEKEGIIERKQFSEWAAPIVPVRKEDGTV